MKQFRLGRVAFVSTMVILVCRLVALPGIAVAQSGTALSFGPPSQRGPGGQQSIDPGVRSGTAGAGGPLVGLNDQEQAFFAARKNRRSCEVDTVPDGLGPRFNLDSCAGCHATPAVGGSSPAKNPQVGVATLNRANVLPSFISLNGPVREARFVRNPDGTPDGGVHDLFVITGRNDAPGCNIKQPDFAGAARQEQCGFPHSDAHLWARVGRKRSRR